MQEAKRLDTQNDAELRGERPRRETTLGTFAEWYLRWVRDERRLLGWKTIRGNLRALVEYFGDLPLRRITRPDVERFLNRRRQTVRPATVNSALRDVKRMFNVAIQEGYLDANPASGIRPFQADRLPVRLPTAEETGMLLDYLKGRKAWLHPLVLVLIGTGCRLGEALGMTWADLDFARTTLNLRRRKVGDVLPIPLDGAVKDTLWNIWTGHGMPREGPVLADAQGKALSRYTVHAAFKAASRRLGMPWLTLRTFRRLAATHVAESTRDVRLAQLLLGHTNVRTTELYLGRADESRRLAVESMSAFLAGLGGTVGGTADASGGKSTDAVETKTKN